MTKETAKHYEDGYIQAVPLCAEYTRCRRKILLIELGS